MKRSRRGRVGVLAAALAFGGSTFVGGASPAQAVVPAGCQFATTTSGAPAPAAMDPLRLVAGGSYVDYAGAPAAERIHAYVSVKDLKATPALNIPAGGRSVSWGVTFTNATYNLDDTTYAPFWRAFLRATVLVDGTVQYEAGQLAAGGVEVNTVATDVRGSMTPGANGVVEISAFAQQLGLRRHRANNAVDPLVYPSYVTHFRATTSLDATIGLGTTPVTTVVDRAPASYASERELLLDPDVHACLPTGAPTVTQARSADGFVDTIGVNTHMGQNTPGPYMAAVPNCDRAIPPDEYDRIQDRLEESGIRHIRDQAPDQPANGGCYDPGATADLFNRLGDANVKLNAVIPLGDYDTTAPTAGAPGFPTYPGTRLRASWTDWLEQLAENRSLASIEGINEPNLNNVDAATAYAIQRDLKIFRDSSPCMNGTGSASCPNATIRIPIVGASPTDRAYVDSLAALGPDAFGDLVDYGNYHAYSPFGAARPYRSFHLDYWDDLTAAAYEGKPTMVTETGWSNVMPPVIGSVDERASGSYVPKALLINAQRGVARTYLYSLLDDPPIPTPAAAPVMFPEQSRVMGILHSDSSPKPAFTGVKHLTALLADAGGPFTPGSLGYSLAGEHLDQLLLQKRDGSFWLALWQNSELYDQSYAFGQNVGFGPLSPPAQTATITLGSARASKTYRIGSGTSPIATAASTTSHTVSVPADDVVLVELS
jgi:hypothetical protein